MIFGGTRARFNDHKYLLDSLEILLFSGTEMLHCLVSSLYSYTHTDLSRRRGKIIANVHGFRVLQQNFNRGDITFLTKKFWGRVKKRLKNQDVHRNDLQRIAVTEADRLSALPVQYAEHGLCSDQASVCLSVCPIICQPHAAAAGLLLSARRARDIDRLLQHGAATLRSAANAGSATFTADVGS